MTEGGISVPAIVRLPGSAGPKTAIRASATFADIAPTLLNVAGLPLPAKNTEVAPLESTSLVPLLEGRVHRAHPEDAVFADEIGGEAYVRRGRWKAVLAAIAEPSNPLHAAEVTALAQGDLAEAALIHARFPRVWRLYDIEKDRGETTDLAAARPQLLAELQHAYETYRRRVGVVDP